MLHETLASLDLAKAQKDLNLDDFYKPAFPKAGKPAKKIPN